jgi:hypothetical protein
VLSESCAFGVTFVDTEEVSLASCRGGKSYLTYETFRVVAFDGAVVGTAVGAWVCVLCGGGWCAGGWGCGPDVIGRVSWLMRLPWRFMLGEGASWYAA